MDIAGVRIGEECPFVRFVLFVLRHFECHAYQYLISGTVLYFLGLTLRGWLPQHLIQCEVLYHH